MNQNKVVIVAGDVITPLGLGLEACWKGLLEKRCAIQPIKHFESQIFPGAKAGVIEDLPVEQFQTRVMAMLEVLFSSSKNGIPQDSECLLATTLGEIEYLEKSILTNQQTAPLSCPEKLLSKIKTRLNLSESGMVVSAACSSSSIAISMGADMIADGEKDVVLVVACDGVSEFLYAGFASLLALDSKSARPFDQSREGLSIGEAAGYVLMMSESRALREGRLILGEVVGWSQNNDANHMTGPSRDGAELARAILKSFESAHIHPNQIASISAHGTGTLYNDAMEIKAFKMVFDDKRPTYSIKGAIGHTMAAAGLIEAMVALKSIEKQKIPATVGLQKVDDEAKGWIFDQAQTAVGEYVLSTNSGFGGVNSALILKGGKR